MDQACPDDNVVLNIKGLDKNYTPVTDVLAGRSEQCAVIQSRKSSRCQHTRLRTRTQRISPLRKRIISVVTRPAQVKMSRCLDKNNTPGSRDEKHHPRIDQACPGENVALDIKQTHHQRVDQACPGENVASDIKDVDKNDMPETDALVGRSEQGFVKSGEERASLPAHTAPIPKMRVELEVKLYTAYATRDTPGGR